MWAPQKTNALILELPAEIRHMILEFALLSEKPTVTFRLDRYQKDGYREASQPSLTRVNRQVRQESLKIFYETNDFIFHTEGPKWVDARKWLKCYEPYLPSLLKVSFWIRYATLANDPREANGAMSIQMQRSNNKDAWQASNTWKWVTVTRKPQEVEHDAQFLIAKLDELLGSEEHDITTAEGFLGVMADLRLLYIQEKMSWRH